MTRFPLVAVAFIVAQSTSCFADTPTAASFSDGLWQGGMSTLPDSTTGVECWARTTFDDQTTLVLATSSDETWHLRLSNPKWDLLHPSRFVLSSLVDFYPITQVVAETGSNTALEIADLVETKLLAQIENGHTITLESDGFSAKYDLEGSAKIIARLRACIAG